MKKGILSIFIVFFIMLATSCMSTLPQGEFMKTSVSPDGEYRVNAYLCNGGATVDYAVRCEAETVSTGEKRNIYWEYHCEEAKIAWVDERTVVINGIELDVVEDSYDWRME